MEEVNSGLVSFFWPFLLLSRRFSSSHLPVPSVFFFSPLMLCFPFLFFFFLLRVSKPLPLLLSGELGTDCSHSSQSTSTFSSHSNSSAITIILRCHHLRPHLCYLRPSPNYPPPLFPSLRSTLLPLLCEAWSG